ncbi:hypothetical protein ACM1RC_08685 [Paenibacillus azoreducens]|uniref:hypothetical protein n=1 Tax=Paenibacillus azoreducens TaxID=116718 RepID=UPI0039F534D5
MLGYQLVQDQRLKLALTPELKQSIHILSLPADELIQYLHEQATENPVLELEDGWEARAYSGRTDAAKGCDWSGIRFGTQSGRRIRWRRS